MIGDLVHDVVHYRLYLLLSCGDSAAAATRVAGLQLEHGAEELLGSGGEKPDLSVGVKPVQVRRLLSVNQYLDLSSFDRSVFLPGAVWC